MPPKVGVLALQGDFREHRRMLEELGASVVEVRLPEHLKDLHAIVLPGGESTAISKLLDSSGLFEPLRERLKGDLASFGTCAGMILLAATVEDGIEGQRSLGVVDTVVRRNGIGPQSQSHERSLDVTGLGDPFPAVFIRPPVVEKTGGSVEVLAEVGGKPVLCRDGRHLVASFHPEISADVRIHRLFLERL